MWTYMWNLMWTYMKNLCKICVKCKGLQSRECMEVLKLGQAHRCARQLMLWLRHAGMECDRMWSNECWARKSQSLPVLSAYLVSKIFFSFVFRYLNVSICFHLFPLFSWKLSLSLSTDSTRSPRWIQDHQTCYPCRNRRQPRMTMRSCWKTVKLGEQRPDVVLMSFCMGPM